MKNLEGCYKLKDGKHSGRVFRESCWYDLNLNQGNTHKKRSDKSWKSIHTWYYLVIPMEFIKNAT